MPLHRPVEQAAPRLQALHVLWQCGLRPFFAAATVAALVAVLPWVLMLASGLPALPGSRVVPVSQWHALLLLAGMGLAAVAGFLLTAMPEFTDSPAVTPWQVRLGALLWLLAFVGDGLATRASLAVAAAAWLLFVAWLLRQVAPRAWAQAGRPQLGFVWAVAALGLAVLGWHVDTLRAQAAGHWLDLLLGVYMVLMVLAMSRISMRIVNSALDEARAQGLSAFVGPYLARPPRRHIAVALIIAHAAVHWAWPGHLAAGWLALAAGAAMLNLLNDWHVGRVLLHKWPLLLYLVYLAMAAGYGLWGSGVLLQSPMVASAGRHVLALAAFGLGILCVFTIAGRNHIGLPLDEGRWVPLAAALLLAAAALRVLSVWPALPGWLLAASGLAWLGAYALVAWRLLPLWLQARRDGGVGCAGPAQDAGRC